MKMSILFPILLLTLTSVTFGQRIYEPKRGSAERAALMDAIRTYDSKRDAAHTNKVFNVSVLRVQGAWAYANVEPVGGSYGQAHVFLQKVRGKWSVAFSTYNDSNEVGVDGLARMKKKRGFPRGLGDFAMRYLAG